MVNWREKKRIARGFSSVRWDYVKESARSQLGRWRADERQVCDVGDITILYNENYPLQVAGRKVCGGYYPLPEARIEQISIRMWKEKIKRW